MKFLTNLLFLMILGILGFLNFQQQPQLVHGLFTVVFAIVFVTWICTSRLKDEAPLSTEE